MTITINNQLLKTNVPRSTNDNPLTETAWTSVGEEICQLKDRVPVIAHL